MVLPENIYVYQKNTPECSELHHLKKCFSAPKPQSNLMYRNTSNSLKNCTPNACTRVMICMQIIRSICKQSVYHYYFFGDNIIIFTL